MHVTAVIATAIGVDQVHGKAHVPKIVLHLKQEVFDRQIVERLATPQEAGVVAFGLADDLGTGRLWPCVAHVRIPFCLSGATQNTCAD